MSEKKYIGSGKTSQYSENCQINLNSLFKQFYEDTKDKLFIDCFEILKNCLKSSNLAYINSWTNKDGKENFELKISVGKRKNPDKIGNDLSITLNEFVAEKKEVKTVVDDLPF